MMTLISISFFRQIAIKQVVFLTILLCLPAISAIAQSPVFVRNYQVGGTFTRTVNGQTVPNIDIPVIVKLESELRIAGGATIKVGTVYTVLTTNQNGRVELTLPCYTATGYSSRFTYSSAIVGLSGHSGDADFSGCNANSDAFLNRLSNTGNSTDPDLQDIGETCSTQMDGQNTLQPNPSIGQPINVTNGNMWLNQTDYSLPCIGENISINRYYNSSLQESGIFGFGWKSEYDESIANFNDNYLILRTGTGRGFYFLATATNVFASASNGFYGQVVKDGTGYTLTLKNGQVHRFYPNGRLNWQKDRNGNQTTLTYSGSNATGNLTSITDAFGRVLNIVSNTNGTVQKIYDALGTINNPIAIYGYDPNIPSLLKTVTYNDGSKYEFDYISKTITVNGQDKTVTLLTTVKDGASVPNILEIHDYDDFGRATTSGKAENGAIEKYTLNYVSTTETDVTDANGKVSKYYFDKSKGRNVLTKMEGVCSGCGGGGSEITTFEYDEKLNLTKKVDALNQQTLYNYDSNGNRTSMTDVLGTETYTYNSFGEILTRTDRMGGVTTNTYDGAVIF